MLTTMPGISVEEASELLQQTDKLIAQHPQVERVSVRLAERIQQLIRLLLR